MSALDCTLVKLPEFYAMSLASRKDEDGICGTCMDVVAFEGFGGTRRICSCNCNSPTTTLQQEAIMTPDSNRTENEMDTVHSGMDFDSISSAIPQSGKTYKIHHPNTGRVLSLVDGNVQLQVQDHLKAPGGWSWTCVEKNGWLGFKNYVSGTFLGLAGNPKNTLQAKVTHHKAYEWFCVRHCPCGGYHLLVHYYGKDELWKLACKDSTTLTITEGHGAKWKFEEI